MNTWIAVFVGIIAFELSGFIISRLLDRSIVGLWLDDKGVQLAEWLRERRERRRMKWD